MTLSKANKLICVGPTPSFSVALAQQSQGELPMNEGRNFFVWLVFMVAIFVTLAVLETLLEVPDIT